MSKHYRRPLPLPIGLARERIVSTRQLISNGVKGLEPSLKIVRKIFI